MKGFACFLVAGVALAGGTPSLEFRSVRGKQQSRWPLPIFRGRPRHERSVYGQNLKKYAATGGWGFAQLKAGKTADAALLKTCVPCHEPVKVRDFVFARYAP